MSFYPDFIQIFRDLSLKHKKGKKQKTKQKTVQRMEVPLVKVNMKILEMKRELARIRS